MFDFPHPFGPTTAVMPTGKVSFCGSAKDLNPLTSRAIKRNRKSPKGTAELL
jgi:hypothetical protein